MATIMSYDRPRGGAARPEFSIPSIVAILCAIGSFMFGAGLGFLLAVVAIVAGLIGVVLALSPRVRGGMMSVVSVAAGLIGIIAAVFRLVF
jgi:hypothetical protein